MAATRSTVSSVENEQSAKPVQRIKEVETKSTKMNDDVERTQKP